MAPGTDRTAIWWQARPRYGTDLPPVRSASGQRTSRNEPATRAQLILDELPEERPFSIEINGHPVATLLCTPDAPAELGAGWAFSHGFFDEARQIVHIKGYPDRVALMIEGRPTCSRAWSDLVTAGFDTASLPRPVDNGPEAVHREPGSNVREDLWRIERCAFQSLVRAAFTSGNAAEPGIHRAALGDNERVRAMAQDISRRNAVDKVIGWALLQDLPRERLLLLVTGQISADIVYKAWRAGLLLVASCERPTRQAVLLAEQRRVTLVGRAHDAQRIVYSHPWRLIDGAATRPTPPSNANDDNRATMSADLRQTR